MKKWTMKDFGKAGFAIGVGLTVGKFIADTLICASETLAEKICERSAKNGNTFAQDVCDRANINYQSETEKNKPNNKIGF